MKKKTFEVKGQGGMGRALCRPATDLGSLHATKQNLVIICLRVTKLFVIILSKKQTSETNESRHVEGCQERILSLNNNHSSKLHFVLLSKRGLVHNLWHANKFLSKCK